jgi:hypothetical protein
MEHEYGKKNKIMENKTRIIQNNPDFWIDKPIQEGHPKWTREESEQNKDKLLQEIQEEPFNTFGENLDWVTKELDQLIDEEEVRQKNKI